MNKNKTINAKNIRDSLIIRAIVPNLPAITFVVFVALIIIFEPQP